MIKPTCLDGLPEDRGIDGNLVISNSKLHELFSPQVKLISNKRQGYVHVKFFIKITKSFSK